MQQYLSGEELIFSAKKDGKGEFEFTLPEYLPGISKIVKSFSSVEKCAVRDDGTQAVFDLSLKLGIIYISDFGGKIKSISFPETISVALGTQSVEDENTVVVPSAFITSVNSRPLGTRKFSTACSYHVSALALRETSREMLSENDNQEVCTLKESHDLCRKITLPEIYFDHDDEITLDPSKPGVNEIIYCDAVFCGASCSVSDLRIDFEGRFMLHILYESADENRENSSVYEIIKHPVTVKQSIENDRAKEGQHAFIYLDSSLPELSVSFDPYGENRIINYSLKYSASPIIFESFTAEIITDAFCENRGSSPVISDIPLDSIKSIVSNSARVSETIRGDIKDLSEITDCSAKILSVSVEFSESKLFAVAKCLVSILGVNSQGELTGFDSTTVLHIPVSSENAYSTEIIPEIILSIGSCDASIKEGLVTAEFAVSVNGVIIERKNFGVVTDLVTDNNGHPSKTPGEIVIYYPSEGDTLWSIAKKYGVNPDTVSKLNSIEKSDLSAKHIVLIP